MEGGGWILCDSFTVRQVVGGDSSNIFSKILSSGITSVGLIESFVSCFYYCVLFFLLLLLLQFERFLRLMMGEHWTRRCQLFLAPYLQTTVDYFYLESNQTCDQLPTFNTHSRLPDSITYPPPLPPPLPSPLPSSSSSSSFPFFSLLPALQDSLQHHMRFLAIFLSSQTASPPPPPAD